MNTTEVRANIERSSKASRAGALQRHSHSQHQRHETPRREPVIHRYGPNARPATIAAHQSRSLTATMDGGFAASIGGGR